MNFYISDLHFGHKNIILYDSRPFNSVEEMNDTMIKNWNNAISYNDTVYTLGDMFCCIKTEQAIGILEQLKGHKVLIKGNHDVDVINEEVIKYFDEVTDYLEVKDQNKNIVLCHYPIPCFNNHFSNDWYHFYGHVHQSFEAE